MKRIWILLALVLVLAGCGYFLSGLIPPRPEPSVWIDENGPGVEIVQHYNTARVTWFGTYKNGVVSYYFTYRMCDSCDEVTSEMFHRTYESLPKVELAANRWKREK